MLGSGRGTCPMSAYTASALLVNAVSLRLVQLLPAREQGPAHEEMNLTDIS